MKEVFIRIRDDFDHELAADKTVPFAYHGTNYEIDLTAANADEFDQAMARYISAARVVVPDKPKKTKRSTSARRYSEETLPIYEQRRRIREWGRTTGWHVHTTGMIRRDIIQAYAETHQDEPILPGTWSKSPGSGRKKAGGGSKLESIKAPPGGMTPVKEIFGIGLRDSATSRRNRAVLAALIDSAAPLSRIKITEAIGEKAVEPHLQDVSTALAKLRRKGLVERAGMGLWKPTTRAWENEAPRLDRKGGH
jgi:hypothetical protein